jgi:hypothetical protein
MMPKHAAEMDAAIMTSGATGLDTLSVQPILEDSRRLTKPPFCSSTQRHDFTPVHDTSQGAAVAWPNAQENLHFNTFSQTLRRANPEVNSSRDGTLSRTDSTCDAVCMPDAVVA